MVRVSTIVSIFAGSRAIRCEPEKIGHSRSPETLVTLRRGRIPSCLRMSSDSKSGKSPTAFGDYSGGIDLSEPASARSEEADPGVGAPSSPPSERDPKGGEEPGYRPAGSARPMARAAPQPVLSYESPRSFPWGNVLLLVVLAALAYGGYYGYCSYQAKNKRFEFTRSLGDLRQGLLKLDRRIGPDDIRFVVVGLATKADVLVEPEDIRPFMEPLSPTTASKLPTVAQMALGIAAKMKNHRTPHLVVGFKVSFVARYGIASDRYEAERYTWLDQ